MNQLSYLSGRALVRWQDPRKKSLSRRSGKVTLLRVRSVYYSASLQGTVCLPQDRFDLVSSPDQGL